MQKSSLFHHKTIKKYSETVKPTSKQIEASRKWLGYLDAEKLGGKTVDEIVSGSAQVDGRKLTSTITGGTQTEQVKSNKVVTYSEDTSGYGSDPAPKKEFTVDHNLGVEPNVMVYVKEGSDYKEADAEVISTISQTTVKLSAYGQKVKFKISP